ncbi:MAG: hypothetical protein GY870_18750 [archaeon]|nr:hypothetical protein [archaeon]
MEENKITKFLIEEDNSRNLIFKRMYQEINKKSNISTNSIREYTEHTLKKWEEMEGKKIQTIFTMEKGQQIEEIDKMLLIFKDYLTRHIVWKRNIRKSLNIASEGLKSVFNLNQ